MPESDPAAAVTTAALATNGTAEDSTTVTSDTKMRSSNGWDGKLRVERHPVITNPEALEDPDYSDEDAPPVEEIVADQGTEVGLNSALR
jgi:hypothetical protein